ncbi:MAG: FtsX-like permease family protein, partial [Candidatus Electrothrix sp. AR3]|nr:FtsX-like permease family protein [Candidatus Electrothrix sp. AR3]
FYSFIHLLRIVVFLSGSLLILTTTVMIGYSIRLTLFSRQQELELLRLVGASNNYIRVPFLLEGAALGALGSAAGITALYLLFQWIQARFSGAAMFSFNFFTAPVVFTIFFLSVLLCAGGSFLSIRKILNL